MGRSSSDLVRLAQSMAKTGKLEEVFDFYFNEMEHRAEKADRSNRKIGTHLRLLPEVADQYITETLPGFPKPTMNGQPGHIAPRSPITESGKIDPDTLRKLDDACEVAVDIIKDHPNHAPIQGPFCPTTSSLPPIWLATERHDLRYGTDLEVIQSAQEHQEDSSVQQHPLIHIEQLIYPFLENRPQLMGLPEFVLTLGHIVVPTEEVVRSFEQVSPHDACSGKPWNLITGLSMREASDGNAYKWSEKRATDLKHRILTLGITNNGAFRNHWTPTGYILVVDVRDPHQGVWIMADYDWAMQQQGCVSGDDDDGDDADDRPDPEDISPHDEFFRQKSLSDHDESFDSKSAKSKSSESNGTSFEDTFNGVKNITHCDKPKDCRASSSDSGFEINEELIKGDQIMDALTLPWGTTFRRHESSDASAKSSEDQGLRQLSMTKLLDSVEDWGKKIGYEDRERVTRYGCTGLYVRRSLMSVPVEE